MHLISVSGTRRDRKLAKTQRRYPVKVIRTRSILRTLSILCGFQIEASDGPSGWIRDALLDDRTWNVTYLVVDVGNWVRRHDVIVPTAALDPPDWQNRACRTQLSRQKVRLSPAADTHKPVWRQQALAMRKYYGTFASWVDNEYGMGGIPTEMKYPVSAGEDPHLRSAMHLLNYEVWADDGEVGRLKELFIDRGRWRVGYLDVHTYPCFQNSPLLVPPTGVKRVSWAGFRVYLHGTRAELDIPVVPFPVSSPGVSAPSAR